MRLTENCEPTRLAPFRSLSASRQLLLHLEFKKFMTQISLPESVSDKPGLNVMNHAVIPMLGLKLETVCPKKFEFEFKNMSHVGCGHMNCTFTYLSEISDMERWRLQYDMNGPESLDTRIFHLSITSITVSRCSPTGEPEEDSNILIIIKNTGMNSSECNAA